MPRIDHSRFQRAKVREHARGDVVDAALAARYRGSSKADLRAAAARAVERFTPALTRSGAAPASRTTAAPITTAPDAREMLLRIDFLLQTLLLGDHNESIYQLVWRTEQSDRSSIGGLAS